MNTRAWTTIPSLLLLTALPAQHPVVQAVVDAVRIDSMMRWVNELSGEVPVDLGSGPETIFSRHKDNPGNDRAQLYLEQKLAAFGYTPETQRFSATGVNVFAVKTGTVYPDDIVILCAHFDAMPGGHVAAPGADDDGSGCGAVLEAARLLRAIDFEHTIVFAFWDEEEQGLVGSRHYARGMAANNRRIRGVVNVDAIAYDGNGDTKARIHVRPIANSMELADSLFAVKEHYGIGLDLLLTNPGARYSDHASFWDENYGAILVIEEFGADGNPYYHTPDDRVQHFDVPYYGKLATLSIATLATLAVPVGDGLSVPGRDAARATAMHAFPNPAAGDVDLWLDVPGTERFTVTLHDALGRELAVLHEGPLRAGRHTLRVPLGGYPGGGYLVVARSEGTPPVTLRMLRLP